jgi:acyl carrier protein
MLRMRLSERGTCRNGDLAAPSERAIVRRNSSGLVVALKAWCAAIAAGSVILGDLVSSQSDIRDWCVKYLASALDLPASQIDPNAKFTRLGMDSVVAASLVAELEIWLDLELAPDVVFEYPTVAELARYLAERRAGVSP